MMLKMFVVYRINENKNLVRSGRKFKTLPAAKAHITRMKTDGKYGKLSYADDLMADTEDNYEFMKKLCENL